jgi:protein-disulfide isomerase
MSFRSAARPSVTVVATIAALLAPVCLPALAQQAASQPEVPSAPGASPGPKFPPIDQRNFTAPEPSRETVEAFLRVSWGYDTDRVWQVQAIEKTPALGVSKVTALVAQKNDPQQQLATLVFYVTPDGKHLIASDVLPFGATPYADARRILSERADGPSRGAADRKFELVEFADLQCPHCKAAQANMDQLVADFPKARIVFEHYPLPMHSEAKRAAEYGVCVTKLGGSSSFFTYAASVFDGQDGLNTPDGATLTLNAAVTKAGQDPAKVAACAALPATVAAVDASAKLARDANVNETPTLLVNGRSVPANVPYATLKQIVQYQMKLDGIQQ